jgi:Zn finger protein HypA/HybF involved in hydrogenase expression
MWGSGDKWQFKCDNCGKEWESKSVDDTKCPRCGYDSTRNWTGEKK